MTKNDLFTVETLFSSTEALNQIETKGYFRFIAQDAEASTLIKIADYFGKRQGHLIADEYGVAEVGIKASCPNAPIVKEQYREQYINMGIGEMQPHTDGSFIEGLAQRKDGNLVRIRRPKMTLLQMVQPAAEGGASVLVDGKAMFEDALHQSPNVIKELMKPSFIFCRDDQSHRSPLFERISQQKWSIRWRGDFAIAIEESALETYQYFYQNYVNNPRYQERFYLQPGEIIIIDNLRVLHSREAFIDNIESRRFLRRTWISDEEITLINPVNQQQNQRAFTLYEPYLCLDRDPKIPLLSVNTGISLTLEDHAVATRLWLEGISA